MATLAAAIAYGIFSAPADLKRPMIWLCRRFDLG
jgi:hypothetical protein